jgi:hypothetical protein
LNLFSGSFIRWGYQVACEAAPPYIAYTIRVYEVK